MIDVLPEANGFTNAGNQLLELAAETALERGFCQVSSGHMLIALFKQRNVPYGVISRIVINPDKKILPVVERFSHLYPSDIPMSGTAPLPNTDCVEHILTRAASLAKSKAVPNISPLDILLAITEIRDGVAFRTLSHFDITRERLTHFLMTLEIMTCCS